MVEDLGRNVDSVKPITRRGNEIFIFPPGRNVGTLQRFALKRLANLLRKDAKNNLILPPRDQNANASEFIPDTIIGGINQQELQTSLSRHHVHIDSAGLPLLKGNHHSKDLTEQGLTGGFIVDASLVNATMTNQNLEGTCISNSNLSGINLKGASLGGATLVNVDLTGADLRGVDLTDSNFVNCNLDRVLLDGATMISTQLQGCTLSNVTIGEGVIDLIACESILTNICFAGRFDGNGLFIQGIGLVDSIMTNAQFSGYTTVNQIELLSSLLVGAGPGILDDAEILVSRESEWRNQMIQVARDAQLGEVTYSLSATGGDLQEHIFWGGQLNGTVPRFEHLQGSGLEQLERYLDGLGLTHGTLVIF